LRKWQIRWQLDFREDVRDNAASGDGYHQANSPLSTGRGIAIARSGSGWYAKIAGRCNIKLDERCDARKDILEA